jgi:hypothetical protein
VGNSVKFELSGEKFQIAGRGTVYTAYLTERTTRDQLGKLIGQPLETPDGKFIIVGVESFLIQDQYAGRPIGLLVKHDPNG